ncbi:hypothetical protein ACOMHN_031786 [Nucella lapillus]
MWAVGPNGTAEVWVVLREMREIYPEVGHGSSTSFPARV